MDQSSSSIFTIFLNNTIRQGDYQPSGGVKAFDFGLVSDGRAIIAYSSSINSGDYISLALIKGKDKIFEQSTISLAFSKLRFAKIDDRDNLVLFGLDSENRRIEVFLVKVVSSIFTIEKVYNLEDVTDFDITDPGNKINLFYTNDEATKLQFKTWNKDSFKNGPTTQDVIDVQGGHQYWLQSVSCVNEGEASSACIINTISNVMFELIVPNAQNVGKIQRIDKFGNYDGKFLYIDEENIAMRSVTTKAPRNYAFLVWKRPSRGGNGKLFTGIPIPGNPTPGTDINSGFTPFTLIRNANNHSMLFAGTNNEFEPLQFYEIQSFRIVTDKSEADLRRVYLNVHTFNGVDYNAGEISSLTNDKRGNGLAWWPFVVGPIIVILLVAVIYYAVNKSKT